MTELRDNLKDPEDKVVLQTIYNEISEIKSAEEAYDFVEKYAPTWIIDEADDYAKEYITFKQNWETIVKMTKQPRRKLLLVSKIVFKENDPKNSYSILKMISEILTRCGYCIRRATEFTKCERCGLAIMSKRAEENTGTRVANYKKRCRECS
jgi:hypothetical protein